MKQCLPILFLWLLAAAVWTGFFTASSAVDSISVSVAPGNNSLPGDTTLFQAKENQQPLRNNAEKKGCVPVNTAGLAQLVSLPGVGPAIAQRIIDYRTQHGAFTSERELDNVKGIGPATLKKMEGQICF